MNLATPQRMTLQEYLADDNSTDTRHELVGGALVEMGAENTINIKIAIFLIVAFARIVDIDCIHRGTEIVVPSRSLTSRFPDLMVLTGSGSAALRDDARSIITLDMPAPLLVIEVVSPGAEGSDNYTRDYIEKRAEYAARGIPEYWLIDPSRQVVMVLTLAAQGVGYVAKSFTGETVIASATFPTFALTAAQILTVGQG